jgi:4-alpha-glucanotransferase
LSSKYIKQLAKTYGIALQYEDARGDVVSTDVGVLTKLLENMGVLSAERERAEGTTESVSVLPPVVVACPKQGAVTIELTGIAQNEKIAWVISLENGELLTGSAGAEREVSEYHNLRIAVVIPGIPFGYHTLDLPTFGARSTLIVTPGCCYLPKSLSEGRRRWGISLQLYLLRSAGNWGIGDFSDLGQLAILTAKLGCDVLGLNPLHQMFLDKPEHASPYSPASRSLLNVLYIDVEAIPEFERSPAREFALSEEFKAAVARCRGSAQVDYPSVNSLKLEALRLVYAEFASNACVVRKRQFAAFVKEGGRILNSSSLYQALRNHFAQDDAAIADWQSWPKEYQSPSSADVLRFGVEQQDEVQFYNWLQWIADEQLAAASRAATSSGMEIGLYRDLAVGCDRTGSETWSDPSDFLTSTQVGAPPDILNPSGQNWGLPPFNPVSLRKQAYRPFINLVRANMRHAGGLRIDHVMGLQRLYCIPEGSSPSAGAYVEYPIDDLIGIIALESHRNGCLVVGEDLGTVPAGFRERMASANILSYRVLFFEQESQQGGLIAPDNYPLLAVAVSGSHDLPTLRGWLEGADIELKQRLGLYPSEEEAARQRALRQEQRAAILSALEIAEPAPAERFSIAIHRFLARTRSVLTMAQLDDLFDEHQPVNVPATSTEHPNWRRKYSVALEELSENHPAWKLVEAIQSGRPKNGGHIGQ